MAAKAAGADAVNEQSEKSVNESDNLENNKITGEEKAEKPPIFEKSISRSSVTFFSGDNARNIAKQKFEALKKDAIEEKGYSVDEENEEGKELFEKELATAVLNFCVRGKFDLEARYVITDAFNVLVLLELIDNSSQKAQITLLTLLQTLLKQSIKNLQACTKVGLIVQLLARIQNYKDISVADKAIDLIGNLATYSITVRELKCFFSALQRTKNGKWPPHALKLLQILKKMPEKHGPDVYFNFSGKNGGVITVPPIARWPHQPGFSFVTWLQLDAAHLSPEEQKNRPHIYCFVNSRGLGYTAHFSGPMLVIEVWGKNGKKQTILVKSRFEPQIWYHLCISHTYNRFKSSEVKVFVNGQMVTSGDITMPSNKEPTDKCFIGGSHLNETEHVFKGQMAAVYVFAEPLGYNTVVALYRMGPGYKGQFKFRTELESQMADTDRKIIYDGKLSQNLLFTYNPKAVDGELCLESSPTENASCFYHSPHALMMNGVYAVVTHSLQAALHSLGGIQMLFPLFTQLDYPLEDEEQPNPKICSILLSLIYDLLRGSSVCQQQMIQSQGFMIIGHLLQKSSPVHLTEETLDILLGLTRFFMATESANGLLGGLLDYVLLEPSLWIKTPLALQSNLLSLFATGYVGGLDYAGYIRKEVGAPRLILMLRKFYSVSGTYQNDKTSLEEIISLRAFVLLLIKQMTLKGDGITSEELKSILVYLAVEEEEENYLDLIQLLLSMIFEKANAIIPCFDDMEGFQVFFKLLVANNEKIRVYSLKILCSYMQQLSVRRKLDLVDKYAFISKIGEKLAIFDITMVTYNALFEFLTARPTKMITEQRHTSPDGTYIMYHPTVLPIIVNLLLSGRNVEGQGQTVDELTMVFLSDLTILLNSNNDNKRLLLQLMCWQDWLFSLAYLETTENGVKITDTVFSIIKMLLSYAIQHEKEGWRVWVDTLSILHSKITFADQQPTVQAGTPQTIFNEQNPKQIIDQETGEVVEMSNDTPRYHKPTDGTSSNPATPSKSPSAESDMRKMFFEKLLLSSDTSVISGTMDNLRKTQSMDNLDSNDDELVEDLRPRSASPNLEKMQTSPEHSSTGSVEEKHEGGEQDTSPEHDDNKDISENLNNESLQQDASVEGEEKDSDQHVESNIKPVLAKRVSSDSKRTHYSKENLNLNIDTSTTTATADDIPPESPASSSSKCRPFLDIPEFSWSTPHQRLLTELLFSVEKDIQVWKTHTRKTLTDFVSQRENSTYIMNLCHMVSILSDSLIYCSGGLLPLMASATSSNFESDVLEACGGMTLDSGFSFMNRVLNIVDVVAFASTVNFTSVETHRNMSAGGVLRQCIRLVFCGAARNRVVCRQRERPSSSGHIHPKTLKETQAAIKTLIASTKPATEEAVVQNIPGHMTTITDPEKLLQDSDINRLRSLIYRECEDSRQSQYVALVVIYFVAVLMVARYRDVLEHDLAEEPTTRRRSAADIEGSDNDSTSPKRRSATIDTSAKPLSLEERMEMIFGTSANLLREVLFDFSHYLSKVLVGSRNQDLISEGLGSLKSEDSTVELVMLLCSQEWQNALQRMAGTAFMDLVDEGRILSHSTRERIVITGSEARDIMAERDSIEILKHAQFETICTRTVISYIEQYKTYDHFFKAKKKRNTAAATQSLEKIFDVLTSEFGAWSIPEVDFQPQYHKLDRWEDTQRRRFRMIKNPVGTSHPQATLRPGSAEEIPPEKPPPLKYHLFTKDVPKTSDHVEIVSGSEDDDGNDVDLDTTIDDKQLYHQQGSIQITTACSVISPGAVVPGTLAITTDSLYYTADDECEELKKLDPQILSYNDCLNVKCSFVNIVAVYSRKYLLQNKAIEIVLANRRSFMFAFPSHEIVKKIIQHLPPVGVGPGLGLPLSRSISLSSPKALFVKSNMLQRWQNKEVSNFEYLMFLNTIVGRTYNDLSQYFVFPWILKDYESKELDLKNPEIYRDLSKPIGALNPFRLGQFVERFDSWEESEGIPPFHYGTHYSTGGFVMNWLVRLEPFASLFLGLQGGKFDHPLRTFSSIKRAWDNCQKDTSDVKELIPELFFLPDMFRNENKFVWGEGEDGQAIDDVILPRWAFSPEHFIHLHREALESEYVSDNLHKWIDLIFGYKQKGKDAEHSANVFYYLTYEGSVDIDAVDDPIAKEALAQQIQSFGQTPHQLLTTPHPPRTVNKEENLEPHKSIFLSFCVTPEVPVTHVAAHTGHNALMPAIITISCNQMFSVNKWINFGGSITSFNSLKNVQIEQDPSLETPQGRSRRLLGEPLHESVTVTSSCFAVTSDNKFIFTSGYWDKSFKCFSTESGKLTQCVFGHWDVVTCLAYSDDPLTATNAIIVSGSSDATVLVWIWDQKGHRVMGPADTADHGSTPIAICTGHELPITCVDVNTSIGIIASGSIEGACLVHSLSGELLRSLKAPSLCSHPRLINISNDNRVLVNYSNDTGYMAMFTSNGKLMSHAKLAEQNLAVVFTKDGCYFVTGGFNRCFHVWRSFDLMLLSVFPPCDGSIRSLALTPDQKCMVAGLSTGSIIAMAMDFSIWPRVHIPAPPKPLENQRPTSESDTSSTNTHADNTSNQNMDDVVETNENQPEIGGNDVISATSDVIAGAEQSNDVVESETQKNQAEKELTAIVNVVPNDDKAEETDVETKPEEKKTSSLVHPVPVDSIDEVDSKDSPKTLLQTAQQISKDPNVA